MKDLARRLARLEAEAERPEHGFEQCVLKLSKSETVTTLSVLFDSLVGWTPDTPRDQIRRELGERFGKNPFGELRSDDELEWLTDLAGRWVMLTPAEQQAVECGDKSLISGVWGEGVDDDPDDWHEWA